MSDEETFTLTLKESELEDSKDYEEPEFESFPDFIATRQEAP